MMSPQLLPEFLPFPEFRVAVEATTRDAESAAETVLAQRREVRLPSQQKQEKILAAAAVFVVALAASVAVIRSAFVSLVFRDDDRAHSPHWARHSPSLVAVAAGTDSDLAFRLYIF
jgi:hypothetical protein